MKNFIYLDEKERAVIVAVTIYKKNNWDLEDILTELRELTLSTGVDVAGEVTYRVRKPTSVYFIGEGKLEELRDLVEEVKPDVVIFSENLTGSQQRNIESILNVKTIDRTQLILDIFSLHAKSVEGKMQVELAQLQYLLPRLTGKGIILSRLGGGIGTRGPGEQKLEIDRRKIRDKIIKIRKELRKISKHRQARRQKRKEHSLTTIAIVGYTNAGKTTLINGLTDSSEYVEDKLFSTLDSVSRRYILPNNQKVVFVDTVGFLHRLPHGLIEAFKATLEDVVYADILIHLIDISHPLMRDHIKAVYEVLEELHAADKPIITVFNKVDKIKKEYEQPFVHGREIKISAVKKQGFEKIIKEIISITKKLTQETKFVIPYNKIKLMNLLYDNADVIEKKEKVNGVHIRARVAIELKHHILSQI